MDYFSGAEHYSTEPIWRSQTSQMVSDWRGSIFFLGKHADVSWQSLIDTQSHSSGCGATNAQSIMSQDLGCYFNQGTLQLLVCHVSGVERGRRYRILIFCSRIGCTEGVVVAWREWAGRRSTGADVNRCEEHTYILMGKCVLPWNCKSLW